MKVAIVGANLLGSATALYTRRNLDANHADDQNHSVEDEIVVFEKRSHAGGNKFVVIDNGQAQVTAGSASDVDVNSAPALLQLMKDAHISLPETRPSPEWALFDWEADSYKLSQMHSRIIAHVCNSTRLLLTLQVFLLSSSWYLYRKMDARGLDAFVTTDSYGERYLNYPVILWFSIITMLLYGIVPIKYVLHLYNHLFFIFSVRIIGGINYGGHSISMVEMLVKQMKQHITVVIEQDSASSCVTLSHLLSACGMAKYAKKSIAEHVNIYNIHQSLLDHTVSPSLAHIYANSQVKANSDTNSLAALLCMLSSCPIPTYLRSRATYLDARETRQLCPSIIQAANAKLRLGIEVTSLDVHAIKQWRLHGISDGKRIDLGVFDAVVIAAAIDPRTFSTDVTNNLDISLCLTPRTNGHCSSSGVNVAKFTSLIKGNIRALYVARASPDALATRTTILNSVNCSKIIRVQNDNWCISSSEAPTKDPNVVSSTFEHMEDVVILERAPRAYGCTPLREAGGRDEPELILGRRLLYAACIDRVANDVNLDILSARNASSLFRNGVADWR